MSMDKNRTGAIRWMLLLALNRARPYGAGELLLLTTVQGEFPDASALEVRRELEYLAMRRLVEIRKDPSGPWHMDLTRYGVDIAEYTIDCEPGIARPAKYW